MDILAFVNRVSMKYKKNVKMKKQNGGMSSQFLNTKKN